MPCGDATLGIISSAAESIVTLDLLVARSSDWEKAAFKRCFIDKDDLMVLKPLSRRRVLRGRTLWTFEAAASIANEFPAVGLKLTSGGRLTSAALRAVQRAGLRLRKH